MQTQTQGVLSKIVGLFMSVMTYGGLKKFMAGRYLCMLITVSIDHIW